jgi:NOL1/NOP2/fmu family ribosome biogenesis protein
LLAAAITGPEVAFRKGTTWFPSYALAMRRDPEWIPLRRISLDDKQATLYVRGLAIPETERGWGVATWNGRALGWLKGDGHQLKNHLPKAGRISIRAVP